MGLPHISSRYTALVTILHPPQVSHLASSNSEKLHEAGLDESRAAAAMAEHVGRLLDWIHTYIPHQPPPGSMICNSPSGPMRAVPSQRAAPIFSLGGAGRGRGPTGPPALPAQIQTGRPRAAAPMAGLHGPEWKGGPLDMGPNSRNGRHSFWIASFNPMMMTTAAALLDWIDF